jgi:hypothetical protein
MGGRRQRDGAPLVPNSNLVVTKLPDATPGIVTKYVIGDKQAVLALARHNRLIDIFLGITCYSLQNRLRTTVPEWGEVETDELYVGLDNRGVHYVVPVQARAGNGGLNRVRIEQDIAVCTQELPALVCRPVGLQLLRKNLIALFSFEHDGDAIKIAAEKHYQLVPADAVTDDDLGRYRRRLSETAG